MVNLRLGLSVVMATYLLTQSAALASESDISRLVNDKKPIKVFVKDFSSDSGQSQIKPEDFKKSFENALRQRKSVNFEVMASRDDSDIEISGAIKKYLYSKTDPVTSFGSPTTLILDAATTENYVEMQVAFTVKDSGTDKVLWDDTISSFIKRTMTAEESIPLIYDKISRNFLSKCFGKWKR